MKKLIFVALLSFSIVATATPYLPFLKPLPKKHASIYKKHPSTKKPIRKHHVYK